MLCFCVWYKYKNLKETVFIKYSFREITFRWYSFIFWARKNFFPPDCQDRWLLDYHCIGIRRYLYRLNDLPRYRSCMGYLNSGRNTLLRVATSFLHLQKLQKVYYTQIQFTLKTLYKGTASAVFWAHLPPSSDHLRLGRVVNTFNQVFSDLTACPAYNHSSGFCDSNTPVIV